METRNYLSHGTGFTAADNPAPPAEGEDGSPLEAGGDESYRLLFNRMPNGFALCEIVLDPSGSPEDFRYLEVNPAFETITGLKGRDIAGRSAREVSPDLEDCWIESCGNVALTGEPASFTSYLRRLDRHFEVKAFSSGGGRFALVLDDITRRVGIEQTLRESEVREKARAAELAAVMEAVPAYVLIAHDPECRRITGNLAACELLRMPPGGNLSKSAPAGEGPVHYRIFRNGAETPNDMLPVQRAARGEEIRDYEQEFVFNDGTVRTLLGNATPLRDEEGLLCGAVSTFVDITERKRMEKALSDSEELFHSLCEAAPIGIFKTDRDGKRIYCSPRCAEISALPASVSPEEGWKGAIHPEDRDDVLRSERTFAEAGEPYWLEYRILTPGGETRWVRVLATPLKGMNGAVTGYVGTVENITELMRVREEREKGQKLESLGVLAGGIAHDFNNILTTILGNVSLARMQLGDGAKTAKRLEEVENASVRAKELSQQLLTFARGGEPVKRAVDVGRLLRDAAMFSLHGSRVISEFNIEEGLPQVEADEGQLAQVVHNLVINAVQSMPDGGTVVVGARSTDSAADGRRRVEISIADTGTGIPEQHLQRIFDPYFSTKQKGSGLGLATSYSIMKKHGGSIDVKSTLGKGSTFYLTLPALERVPEAVVKPGEGAGRDARRILVMDDEDQVRDILQDMLEELGFQAECAADGAEALELYRMRMEEGRPFSVVILDLTIPGGVGGKETIISLKEMDPAVNAVVSSGYSTDPIMANFREYGFRAVLEKPYRLNDMEKVFRELIG